MTTITRRLLDVEHIRYLVLNIINELLAGKRDAGTIDGGTP